MRRVGKQKKYSGDGDVGGGIIKRNKFDESEIINMQYLRANN